jgi:DNA-binding transcriptional LysR family regulator
MNLTLRQIRYVCEVARQGSIQGASEVLNISQSSILAAISLAESDLGARIFERRPARGVNATPAGERFVSAGRALLSAEGEFAREVGVLATRAPEAIRIGCFEPFGPMFMPEVLRRYVDAEGQLEISLFEGNQQQLRDWLATGFVDVIFAYDIGPSFGESVTPICRVPTHAILAADDPLAGQDAVTVAELSARPLVLLDLPLTATYLMTVFEMLAQKPRVHFRTRSYDTVRCAVASGFGASVLNMRPLGRAAADGPDLIRRPFVDELPSPRLIVADVYGTQKPAFVRRLIDVTHSYFRGLGAEAFTITTDDRRHRIFDI